MYECHWCKQPIRNQIPLHIVEPDSDYKEEVAYHEDCYKFAKMLNTERIGWKVTSDPGPPYVFPTSEEHGAAIRRAEDLLAELGKDQRSEEPATQEPVD